MTIKYYYCIEFQITLPFIMKYSIIFLLISILSFIPKLKAQISKQDSLALVDLYNSTGGSHWVVKYNWLTKSPVSSWYGIKIDTTSQRVLSINLYQDSLSGQIPSSLGNLNFLDWIILSKNNLTGSIPNSIGKLTKIESLILSDNNLSGPIPSSIGNLINLHDLELQSNQLSGSIPSSIGNLTALVFLWLGDNQLSGAIPSSIGNLKEIGFLQLRNNQLSGSIPPSFGNLINLQFLYLQNNQLSGSIPASFSQLKNIGVIELYSNQFNFTGIEQIIKLPMANPPIIGHGYFAFDSIKLYNPQGIVPLNIEKNTLFVSVGGTPSFETFYWYRNDTLVATIAEDSIYSPKIAGKYWVIATNKFASELILYSDSVEFVFKDTPIIVYNPLFVSNAFTPNNDGHNDVFRVSPYFYASQFDMIIYNRCGQKLFESNNSTQGWDGTFNGINQDAGTYVWMVVYKDKNNTRQTAKGTVILLR